MVSAVKLKLNSLLAVVFCLSMSVPQTGFSKTRNDTLLTIPLGGNAWRTDKDTIGGNISDEGIVNWSNPKASYTAYVRVGKTGSLKLYLDLAEPIRKSKIAISILGVVKPVTVSGKSIGDVFVGEWQVTDTGYVAIKISGLSKTGSLFADIRAIKLGGIATGGKINYVKDNKGQFYYWGRRGPSVHLGYVVPDGVSAEWFYNELTVPEGNDVLGSYFMADGFGEGYFGMQVNSPTERHILFSVWSPFTTDDPKAIPADQRINLLKKGEKVHTGEFGNEGSGGQSYLNYLWKAGMTYKFLMHAKPDGNGRTEYTAYFYAPELDKWQLIASFSRPHTSTYLKHLHSFLENFEPEQGTISRQVLFSNQWILDTAGKWIELTKARFTGDNTAVQGYRMDYAGGLTGNSFFLKNCGFFKHYTPRNTYFERAAVGKMPDMDLGRLP